METLKEKVEWLLAGGSLTDKKEPTEFIYRLDLETKMFYGISKRSVRAKNPRRIGEEPILPLGDMDENMKILR